MIIIDMNQICLASVMMSQQMSNSSEVDDKMIRHMILNSIRLYRGMFNEKYGEVVLTYDSKHYWRRDYFEQYKHNRKKGREKDSKDWNAIFECLNQIKSEFKENLPYRFIEVYGAEADDIIATLVKYFKDEEIMIVSGDKDFIQLQTYTNVKQYSPILKKFVNGEDPETYIKQHILKGDASDGIPNVLSPDHTFVEGLRQRPLTKKKIEAWVDMNIDDFEEEVKRNYIRNQKLIDLKMIPENLEKDIMVDFCEAPINDRSKLFPYFTDKRLRELTENIGEF
tara:strand:- start:1426 stop:2268 length:843 start_codon:yes stop_codon:yes gene_type:complete